MARGRAPVSLALDLAGAVATRRSQLEAVTAVTWPCDRYARDIPGYARDVFGIELWDRQVEIANACYDNMQVAVASANKCGKSLLAAVVSLWFVCSFEGAITMITAPTAKQSNRIVWKEIKRLVRLSAKVGFAPIVADIAKRADTGLEFSDGRAVFSFAPDTKEGAQGYSGRVAFILDEASGYGDEVYEAILANTAGGRAFIFAIANPTKVDGFFYRAFKDANTAKHWKTYHISGKETPNYKSGTQVIPDLHTREFEQRIVDLYGKDSSVYKIRVEGQFAEGEEGKVISVPRLVTAQDGWLEAVGAGPLIIGLDPAGPGQGGDKTVFAPLRGFKNLGVHDHQALTAEQILQNLLRYIQQYALDVNEMVTVMLDAEGQIGNEVLGVLRAASRDPRLRFRVVPVHSGRRPENRMRVYELPRDEMWARAAQWFREGGKIPTHHLLFKDLNAPSWERSTFGREKITHKDDLRKMLGGRSPDFGDALVLAIWGMRGHTEFPEHPTGLDRQDLEERRVQSRDIRDWSSEDLDGNQDD